MNEKKINTFLCMLVLPLTHKYKDGLIQDEKKENKNVSLQKENKHYTKEIEHRIYFEISAVYDFLLHHCTRKAKNVAYINNIFKCEIKMRNEQEI